MDYSNFPLQRIFATATPILNDEQTERDALYSLLFPEETLLPIHKKLMKMMNVDKDFDSETFKIFCDVHNITSINHLTDFMKQSHIKSLTDFGNYLLFFKDQYNTLLKAPVKKPTKIKRDIKIKRDTNVKRNLLNEFNNVSFEDFAYEALANLNNVANEDVLYHDPANQHKSFTIPIEGINNLSLSTKRINDRIKFSNNLENKSPTLLANKNIFELFNDNKGKTLVLSDNQGRWTIWDHFGYKELIRYSKSTFVDTVGSYFSFIGSNHIEFFMGNGHKFFLVYNDCKFGVGDSINNITYYDNYLWQ